MRMTCPHCEKAFLVYPVPTRQAIQHRRAGLFASVCGAILAAIVYGLLGPRILDTFHVFLSAALPERAAAGLIGGALAVPVLFLAMGIYDRRVPHYIRSVDANVLCRKCGYILTGFHEPQCPQCATPTGQGEDTPSAHR